MAAKLQQISELSKFLGDKTSVCNDFISLLGEFRLARFLRHCHMEKKIGARSVDLLRCLLVFRLCGLSIYQSYCQRFGNMIVGGKNQFYRFLNHKNMDWLKTRVREMTEKKTDVAIAMLRRMYKYGIHPTVLLMDKWFCSASFIREVSCIAKGAIHVITLLRDKRTKLVVSNKTKSANQIAKDHETKVRHCRKYHCRYFRIDATMDGIPVRLFFVKYGRCNDLDVLFCTQTDITFIKAFEQYQIRWGIEVLFKECKTYLDLGGCQSTNLNAQFADCTLVFIVYSIIALRKRFSDYETFGGLYRDIQAGLLELTLLQRILPLIAHIIEELLQMFDITPTDILERAMADNENYNKLMFMLKYSQSIKEQGDNPGF